MSQNIIEGVCGKLGTGKSTLIVTETYDKFLDGANVASNIPLSFRHEKISSIEDFINLERVEVLGDEIWAQADNRKRSMLTDLAVLFCLRSRKKEVNLRYTQQFLQIDVRIAFLTNLWEFPQMFPYQRDLELPRLKPEYMIVKRYDGDLEPLAPKIVENLDSRFPLFETKKDPYFVKDLLNEKLVKKVKKELAESLTDEQIKEYNKIRVKRGEKKFEFL